MASPRIDLAQVAELLPYARTANQRMVLTQILESQGVPEAATALGIARGTAFDAVRKARAYRQAHEARHATPIDPHVPADHRLKGVSSYVDADGKIDRQWVKTELDSLEEPHTPIVPSGFEVDGVSTMLDAQGKARIQWVRSNPKDRDKLALLKEAASQAAEAYAGFCKPTKPAKIERASDVISVYGMGDPHIGMLSHGVETGANFDLKIATERTSAVVSRLVQAAAPSETALLALIGDNFHADDDRQVTPGHGHKLDVDGRAPKVFRTGCMLWLAQITKMLTKHRKVLVNVTRGNHDPLTAFFLREWLCAMFKDEPRVEILDNVPEHQYLLFGGVLLGLTHGHKTKPEGLVGVMATDVPEMWAAAKACRHWLTGHIHSKTFHELRGCTLETLRTLATNDAHAQGAGYRSGASSVVIDFHAVYGEIGRQTVTPARAGVEIVTKPRGYTVQVGAR